MCNNANMFSGNKAQKSQYVIIDRDYYYSVLGR